MNVAAISRSIQNAAKKTQSDLAKMLPPANVPASANVRLPKLTRQRPMKE